MTSISSQLQRLLLNLCHEFEQRDHLYCQHRNNADPRMLCRCHVGRSRGHGYHAPSAPASYGHGTSCWSRNGIIGFPDAEHIQKSSCRSAYHGNQQRSCPWSGNRYNVRRSGFGSDTDRHIGSHRSWSRSSSDTIRIN